MSAPRIADDAQIPADLWREIIALVRGGVTDPLVISSRFGVSAERAPGLVRTVQMMPQIDYRRRAAKKPWGRR